MIIGTLLTLAFTVALNIATALLTKKDVTNRGPQLGDLTVTSSAPGLPRRRGWGSMRQGGNIIAGPPIREQENVDKQKQGGFLGIGASTITTITYTYFGTWAVGFGTGIAKRAEMIFFDRKKIFDVTGTDPDVTKEDVRFRFYKGTATQGVDPSLELDVFTRTGLNNNTPAYRGEVYIVFDEVPLEDYGNRIPNVEAVIMYQGTDIRPFEILDQITIAEGGLTDISHNNYIFMDWDSGRAVYVDLTGGFLRRFNWFTMQEDYQRIETEVLNSGALSVHGASWTPDGFIYVTTDEGTNSNPIVKVDMTDLKEKARFGDSSAALGMSSTQFESAGGGTSSYVASRDFFGNRQYFVLMSGIFNSIGLLDSRDMSYVWDSDTFAPGTIDADERVKGTVPGRDREAWIITGRRYVTAETLPINIWKLTVRPGARYDSVSGVSWGVRLDLMGTLDPDDFIVGATDLTDNGTGVMYDSTDDSLIWTFEHEGLNDPFMVKWNATDGVKWVVPIDSNSNVLMGWNQSRLNHGTVGIPSNDPAKSIQQFDTLTGELIIHTEAYAWPQTAEGFVVYDSHTETLLRHEVSTDNIIKSWINKANADGVLLSQVVTDICELSGLASSDIVVSELTDLVKGYLLTEQQTGRDALEPLTKVYLFDAVESDWLLEFPKRGKSVSETIPQQDLAIINDSQGEFLKNKRLQEVELPEVVSLSYRDQAKDYQEGHNSYKRIRAPFPAMQSRNRFDVTITGTLTPQFAKRWTQQTCFTAWIERNNFEFNYPWRYIAVDPADVIDLALDSGTTFRTRMVSQEQGANFFVEAVGVSEEAVQYTSNLLAETGGGFIPQLIFSSNATRGFLIDIPLFGDNADNGRLFSSLFTAANGYGQNWAGAVFYESDDNANFDVSAQHLTGIAYGITKDILGDTSDPFVTDNVNTVTVRMTAGADPVTDTEANVLDGFNVGVLVNALGEPEIFQWQDTVTNADGSVTLSKLFRGRRGTEVFTGGHENGELFLIPGFGNHVMVDLDLANFEPAAAADTERFYKFVPVGATFGDADSVPFTSQGRDLMPYAPVHVEVIEDGGNNFDFTWVRRTRVGGDDWVDGTGDVPLNETSENYEVDIFDGPGGTLLRTLSSTTEAVQYDNADIVTDFGTPPATIDVVVYQLSDEVGRGFGREDNLIVG